MTDARRVRRERPEKPGLSRQWLIDATIEIMRTEGLEKATMRRVAQALETGPSSLYVYVANTNELHAAVLDQLIGGLTVDAVGAWHEQLDAVLRAYTDVLFAYPGLARSALVLRPSGPNILRLYDRVFGLLLAGGAEAERAAWGSDVLLQFVTATAAEHSAPVPEDAVAARERLRADPLARAVQDITADVAPNIAAHRDVVLSGTPDTRFTWAVHALVAGITATATAVASSDES